MGLECLKPEADMALAVSNIASEAEVDRLDEDLRRRRGGRRRLGGSSAG